jgi:hypothetical protein
MIRIELMNNGFKKWVCNKGNDGIIPTVNGKPLTETDGDIPVNILIKAMWAINRHSHLYIMQMRSDYIELLYRKDFYYVDHNDSEIEALTACLKYIDEQEKG